LRTGGKHFNLPIIENDQQVITDSHKVIDELPDSIPDIIPDGITTENETQEKTILEPVKIPNLKKGKSLFRSLLEKLGILK